MRRLLVLAVLFAAFEVPALAQGFDHSHKAWDALLKKHVVLISGGKASQVNYAGMAQDRAALKTYLDGLSKVAEAEFNAWSKAQRMAFLINAYNAFMVEKVLARFPNIGSVWGFGKFWDVGKFFGNPFKDRFFTLFGREFSLDAIEHEMLRKPGAYDEPRVHFAVNCASVGCPMLREEAYVAEPLERQLEEQTQRFLSDHTRNRFADGRLEVSEIFKWFKEDWTSGYRGFEGKLAPIHSREQFFVRYAKLLSDNPEHQMLIAEGKASISHLDYDWTLNDVKK